MYLTNFVLILHILCTTFQELPLNQLDHIQAKTLPAVEPFLTKPLQNLSTCGLRIIHALSHEMTKHLHFRLPTSNKKTFFCMFWFFLDIGNFYEFPYRPFLATTPYFTKPVAYYKSNGNHYHLQQRELNQLIEFQPVIMHFHHSEWFTQSQLSAHTLV